MNGAMKSVSPKANPLGRLAQPPCDLVASRRRQDGSARILLLLLVVFLVGLGVIAWVIKLGHPPQSQPTPRID